MECQVAHEQENSDSGLNECAKVSQFFLMALELEFKSPNSQLVLTALDSCSAYFAFPPSGVMRGKRLRQKSEHSNSDVSSATPVPFCLCPWRDCSITVNFTPLHVPTPIHAKRESHKMAANSSLGVCS
jgi:hypothetical protein